MPTPTSDSDFARNLGFISTLKPVGKNSADSAIDTLTFAITVDTDGEPWVTVQSAVPADDASLNGADARLLKEMRRASGAVRGFDNVWRNDNTSLRVSLYRSPYLIHLIPDCKNVLAPNGERLEKVEDSASPLLTLHRSPDSTMIVPRLVARFADGDVADPVFIGETTMLAGKRIVEIASVGDNFAIAPKFINPVPTEMLDIYLSVFLTYVDNVLPELDGTPARKSAHAEHLVPTLILEKVGTDLALYIRVAGTVASLNDELSATLTLTRSAQTGNGDEITIRHVEDMDIRTETQWLADILESSAPSRKLAKEIYREDNFFIVPAHTAGPFLLRHLPTVLEHFKLIGSDKLREYKIKATKPRLNLNLSSGIDFLEGTADITVGEERFSIADFLKQYAQRHYVQLSDGNRAIIDERYIARLHRIFNKKDGAGKVRLTVFDLPEVEELIASKITGDFARHARSVFDGLNNLTNDVVPPYKVNAKLRRYQDEGVKWIKYLYDNELGGCLADDMGLGKTLQTIAVLSTIYPDCGSPALVVMPRTLLFNWEKELRRFAPQISAHTYYGTGRDITAALRCNIILTTYATVRNDIEKLRGIDFEYIILDESQNIKNVGAQTTQAIMLLTGRHRLALSGTPIENNLTELYSLFRFLNPTMFGDFESFNESYTYPIQRNGDKDAVDSLRRRIYPFVLRRLKKNVLDDLPERIDQTIYVEMSEGQKKIYNERRLDFRRRIDEMIVTDGIEKARFVMFQALNELRRLASVPESATSGTVSSPKIELLVDALEQSVANGHKAVVFFNFIAGIELVGERLQKAGIEYETMTGSASANQRKKIVDKFQTSPQCKVLLMTLKVGGVGLNLTAADTVYIFEPWWNKAAEEQGVDRLHRIGQKATVNSFSLITVDTIEERILQLQEQKRELFDQLISADSPAGKQLTQDDINFILS